MKRVPLIFLLAPAIVLAQASFPTEFPEGAIPVEPEMLRQRLSGNTFSVKPIAGSEYQIQYRATYAYLRIFHPGKAFYCSGPWRVEGSVACADYAHSKNECSEFRIVGDVLYTKVIGNGEVVAMRPD